MKTTRLTLGLLLLTWVAVPLRAATLDDALDAPSLTWTTDGTAPWFAQSTNTHDGAWAAQAGAVGYAQNSRLKATVNGPGTLVFWASVETGAGATQLSVGYDNVYPLGLYEQSPAVGRGWKAYALDVPSGSHEVQFLWHCHASDPIAAATQRAWVDQVSFEDYSGQAPVLVAQPADVAAGEDYLWTTGVTMTGALPFTAILQRVGFTYTYPFLNRSRVELQVDRVYPNFAGPWRLILTNQFGAVTSQVFSLTVTSSPPIIRWGPYSVDTGLGSPLELVAGTAGSPPLHHQWQKDGADVPGQNASTLSIPATTATDAGDYRLVITNAFGAVTSQVATVTLSSDPPVIYQEPQSQTLMPGDSLELWVDAGGSPPLHFQWQKDGVDLQDATYSGLWFDSVTTADTGEYRIIITNLFGAATSVVATVTVSDPLADALDATNVVFASYDSLRWMLVTDVTHDGVDAAQSSPINDSGFTGLTTTLIGPGMLKFWWKVSSEPNNDRLALLELEEGGPMATVLADISGEVDWEQRTFHLGAGPHHLLWQYTKNESQAAGNDAAWLDQVEWLPPATGTLNEAVDEPTLVFTDGGLAPWFFQSTNTHDGLDAAQSAPIPEDGRSMMQTTVTGPGTLTFWWKVSSEGCCDHLALKVDGEQQSQVSGEAGWEEVSVSLGSGTHELQWEYSKDSSVTEGADAGWVDQVVWTPAPPPTLAEALDAPAYEFLVFENSPLWFAQTTNTHDGVDAVQCAVPPVNSQYWLYTTITGPGTLTFWGKISAASGDTLMFMQGSSSRSILYGEWDWRQFTYEIEPGSHTVGWAFWKENQESAGLNAVFLDEITFTPRIAPTIVSPPQPVKLLKGRSFNLYVNAVGEPPLEYRWQRNGTNIPDANGPSYSRADAAYEDTGNYAVAVFNAFGGVTSSWARVAVVPGYYTIQNLGTLGSGNAESEAYDINSFGEIVGRAQIDESKSYGNRLYHGFAWTDPTGMFDLGDGRIAENVAATNRLPGYSCAYALNDGFDIVGYYEYRVNPTQDGYAHATYWRQMNCAIAPPVMALHCPLELVDMHPRDIYVYPPDTVAVAVNQWRQILLQGGVGWVLTHYGYLLVPQDPWDRFSPFTTRLIGGGSGGVDPYGMNASGIVVGRYREFIGGDMPYLYDGSAHVGSDAMTNAFSVPATQKRFSAISDRGVIAGYYATNTAEGYMVRHAFLFYPDGRCELPPDPSLGLYDLKDINNRNQVVGSGNGGILYTDGYGFQLNDLLSGGSGANILTANAINDRGQIVGQAQFPAVGLRAYLLTPGTPGNHEPVAMSDTLEVPRSPTLLIPAAALLSNDSDADANPLYLDSVFADGLDGLTQAGGRVHRQGGTIRYTAPEPAIASDTFSYRIGDGAGGDATAQVTILFSEAAPAPVPLINPPEVLNDGSIRLSGQAPAGSTVWIFRSANLQNAEWIRDLTLTVPASGQWSARRPGQVGGQPLFYRAELQTP